MFNLLPFLSPLLQQEEEILGLFTGLCGTLVGLAVAVVMILAMWKLFVKAGKPGWASLIPIYQIWVMLEIVGRPGWWLLLMLIPGVNFIIWIIVMIDLAKSFGKETGFAIGLILLPFIFMLILAFGKAQYQGPAAA